MEPAPDGKVTPEFRPMKRPALCGPFHWVLGRISRGGLKA